jgi:hypothetical protein
VKVALLCGPSPAGRCGVGDYTGCLAKALRASGVQADIVGSDNWHLASGFAVTYENGHTIWCMFNIRRLGSEPAWVRKDSHYWNGAL